ncbi:SUN domain-containing protein 2-like [Senna tora]|uniref:SUN domain-containing protein 2-like n=1 Tax=Senna tora TaxID=362788 RepID=A0A834W1W2_9FABA|nr:SUN domain-containing protein 2-like [Senna tora]
MKTPPKDKIMSNPAENIFKQQQSQSKPDQMSDSKAEKSSTNTDDKVIADVPISFKRPGDDVIYTNPRKMRETSETPEGWECVAKPRKNGIIDKFYFNKESNLRCRSLKEIDRFQNHGIVPGQRGKQKQEQVNAKEKMKFYFNKESNLRCRSLKEIDRFQNHGIVPGQRGKQKQEQVNAKEKMKFYFNKESNLRCRSLKEIDRFQNHGIVPGQRGKQKQEQVNAKEKMKNSQANENVKTGPDSES